MTQEELNTRLNELLDKYTRKELPFFEVVIAGGSNRGVR